MYYVLCKVFLGSLSREPAKAKMKRNAKVEKTETTSTHQSRAKNKVPKLNRSKPIKKAPKPKKLTSAPLKKTKVRGAQKSTPPSPIAAGKSLSQAKNGFSSKNGKGLQKSHGAGPQATAA